MRNLIRRSPSDPYLLILLAVFVLSRMFLRLVLGVRFDMSSLTWAWQLLDPAWLRSDPITSVWYMHMQPPLFNLLTAFALRTPFPSVVLDVLFLTSGFLIAVLLYRLALQLGLPRPLSAIVVAMVFVLNPSSFLYETWYFYTYPVLFLTALFSLILVRAIRNPTFWRLTAALSVLTVLTLTRSSYHLITFAIVGLALLHFLKERWKIVLMALAITSLPTLLWYGKNYALFGTFSPTSWTGMNLTRLVWNMPGWGEEKFRELHDEGIVSVLMTTYPFSPPEVYSRLIGFNESTGVVVLDAFYEPTTGGPNYNHAVYPLVSGILLRDNINLARRYPYVYVRAVASAFKNFTYPPYAYVYMGRFHLLFDKSNLRIFQRLKPLLRVYDLLYGWPGKRFPGITVLLFIVAFFLLLPRFLKRPDTGVLGLFLLYLIGVHTAFERRENMRFRFQFEAVLVLLIVSKITQRNRKKGRGGGKGSFT